MVYYHTSGNVKILRNIMIEYGGTTEISPYEYMKSYIGNCPEAMDDAKLAWTAETFLGIHKHLPLLKTVSSHMSEQLTEEEQDYFIILFYAVLFQITPTDTRFLYKCLFNLSKQLLYIFTNFFSNNEVLPYISQVAQASYDTNYITDKIIGPLFTWQGYISEMAHNYAEYVKKMERRKLKLPTIPVNLNILTRKGKRPPSPQKVLPNTPPNSAYFRKKKMMTKSTIDLKLKQEHEKNRQKAITLLNDVKSQDYHYAQVKPDKDLKTKSLFDETEVSGKNIFKARQKSVLKNGHIPVKETAATLKKLNSRILKSEQEEIKWLDELVNNCNNTNKVEELEERDRQAKERERLLDITKKHLLGQISHEEALLARQKIKNKNKEKYELFVKEKQTWNDEIERWKREELEKSKKHVENMCLSELNVIEAKNNLTSKRKEEADNLKKQFESAMAKAMKERKEELEKRIQMIKEIKILALVARKAKVPKIIDLTESSGLGLLCEMSIAELQERLSVMKVGLKEELDRKKETIREENKASKKQLENMREIIGNYKNERAMLKKSVRKTVTSVDQSSKEITQLKTILEEKRKLRMQLPK